MDSRRDQHDRYLDKLEKHITFAKEASKYSSDRFDILLISLSTTALILSIGFVDKAIPDLKEVDTSMLKFSWLLFVITLIANLSSQISGYYANQYDIKVTRNLIREERGKFAKGNQNRFERYCQNLNKMTIYLNGISFISLIMGIIILIRFISQNF